MRPLVEQKPMEIPGARATSGLSRLFEESDLYARPSQFHGGKQPGNTAAHNAYRARRHL
jgi:hypothetical protein